MTIDLCSVRVSVGQTVYTVTTKGPNYPKRRPFYDFIVENTIREISWSCYVPDQENYDWVHCYTQDELEEALKNTPPPPGAIIFYDFAISDGHSEYGDYFYLTLEDAVKDLVDNNQISVFRRGNPRKKFIRARTKHYNFLLQNHKEHGPSIYPETVIYAKKQIEAMKTWPVYVLRNKRHYKVEKVKPIP